MIEDMIDYLSWDSLRELAADVYAEENPDQIGKFDILLNPRGGVMIIVGLEDCEFPKMETSIHMRAAYRRHRERMNKHREEEKERLERGLKLYKKGLCMECGSPMRFWQSRDIAGIRHVKCMNAFFERMAKSPDRYEREAASREQFSYAFRR